MRIDNFIRFSEAVKLKNDKRVRSVTVRPKISDCTGEVYFTDLQLQEGDKLTGFSLHTKTMLVNGDDIPRYQNGVIRGSETVILFNTGKTTTGLDVYIYPQAIHDGG